MNFFMLVDIWFIILLLVVLYAVRILTSLPDANVMF